MKLLLDTHIWLWSLLEPKRLGRQVAQALRAPKNELWISPVSVWELAILVERGRVELPIAPRRWVEEAFAAGPFREAPMNGEVALRSREVHLPHQDPADRFLAATASVYELILVTADAQLLAGRGFRHLANR